MVVEGSGKLQKRTRKCTVVTVPQQWPDSAEQNEHTPGQGHGDEEFQCSPCLCGSDSRNSRSSSVSVIFPSHSGCRHCRVLLWCLSVGCHSKISLTRWLKQQIFTSHILGGLGSPRLRSSTVSFWWGPFLAYRCPPFSCALMGWRGEERRRNGEGEGERESERGERRQEERGKRRTGGQGDSGFLLFL